MNYNSENQLVSVVVPGSPAKTVTYDYDALGRRITRWVNGLEPTRYTYDHWDVIHETRLNDTQVTRFITGRTSGGGIDQPLRRIGHDGTALTYHADVLGSIVALTNASGGVVERYRYDAFGAVSIYDASGALTPISGSGAGVGNEHFYMARRLDPLTGFYEYRHRDYDPATGRFLQPDPLGYIDGPNVYAYAGNSPANFNDPYGLSIWAWLKKMLLGEDDKPDNTAEERYDRNLDVLTEDAMTSDFANQTRLDRINGQHNAIIAGQTMGEMVVETGRAVVDPLDAAATIVEDPSLNGVALAGMALVPGPNFKRIPGNPFTGADAPAQAFKHLQNFHGIDPHVASNRLHTIKKQSGLGASDDVAIGRTDDVYDVRTGEHLGSLTDPDLGTER